MRLVSEERGTSGCVGWQGFAHVLGDGPGMAMFSSMETSWPVPT